MRVAASHIRVGTFELFAALGDHDSLRLLAEHTVQRHFPHRASADGPALAVLEEAIERQASLIAQWMRVGFVHGVMNTDNMALSGETIDYGPCAFIDAYHPGAVFSSIDHHGRYAFGQQPGIAAWNLARLAEALLPIVHPTPATAVERAQAVLDGYSARFEHHWLGALRGKLGLFNEEPDDEALGLDLLQWMQDNGADYTRTFRALAAGRASADADSRAETGTGPDATAAFAETGVGAGVGAARDAFATWHRRWADRLARQPQAWPEVVGRLRAHNPAIIPRNHAVQAALDAASTKGDLKPVLDLLAAFAAPYEEAGLPPALLHPPPPGTPPCRTFCGT
jgi:uncharacterized protein YdiU (UPF0061 family)